MEFKLLEIRNLSLVFNSIWFPLAIFNLMKPVAQVLVVLYGQKVKLRFVLTKMRIYQAEKA